MATDGDDISIHSTEEMETWRMDDYATMQMEIQESIDSQTSMMHDLFGHFGN
jgi:hypothetical protein